MLKKNPTILTLASVLSLAMSLSSLTAQDWTRFRGPNGSGISEGSRLPEAFDAEGALLWSVEVPFGRSSPAVGGDRIFLTAIEEENLVTMAVGRRSGEVLWRSDVERDREADLHSATDSSTPSPVTDGENVFVFFQEFGLVSYDAAGGERWRLALGPFRNFYGIAASPILAGDLVIVVCDQAGGSYLLAVDRDTGREVWRQNRNARRESYTTPLLYPNAEAPEWVLVSGSKYLDAYHARTGELAWTVPGLGAGPVASPVLAGDRIYVVAPDHNESPRDPYSTLLERHDANADGTLAIEELEGVWMAAHFGWLDMDGDGSLSAADWEELDREVTVDSWGLHAIALTEGAPPEIVWNYRPNASYIPTPIVYRGLVYMIDDSIVTALDAGTGELVKRGRAGKGKIYASPTAADGEILIATLAGELLVLKAGSDWDIVRTHDLGDEIYAAPAIVDDTVFVRTRTRLMAYGGSADSAEESTTP